MCTNIAVTRRCVPLSRQMNIAGSNIIVHAVVTMETLLHFQELKGISKKTVFLKDGYDVSAGGFFVVSTFS